MNSHIQHDVSEIDNLKYIFIFVVWKTMMTNYIESMPSLKLPQFLKQHDSIGSFQNIQGYLGNLWVNKWTSESYMGTGPRQRGEHQWDIGHIVIDSVRIVSIKSCNNADVVLYKLSNEIEL